MGEDEGGRPRRTARGKRATRINDGDRIAFRLSAAERRRLIGEAGELGISNYIRQRLFGGRVRNRDALRKIAALHVIGRRVQQLAEKPGVDAFVIAETLGDICVAVGHLIDDLDEETSEAPIP